MPVLAEPARFGLVPMWVIERARTDVWMYAYVQSIGHRERVTQDEIAEQTGVSLSTARRALRALVACGALRHDGATYHAVIEKPSDQV